MKYIEHFTLARLLLHSMKATLNFVLEIRQETAAMTESSWKLTRVFAAAVLLAATMLPFDSAFARTAGRQCDAADPFCYNFVEGSETGNNDLNNPQLVVGNGLTVIPGYSGIEGSVGDGGDAADVFEFYFGGGAFAVQVLCLDNTTCTGGADSQRVVAKLYDIAQNIQGDKAWNDSDQLSNGADLTFANLAAGNYLLQVYATLAADPPYLATFETGDGLTGDLYLIQPAQIPEPATLALVGLGLLGLGIRRRRQV